MIWKTPKSTADVHIVPVTWYIIPIQMQEQISTSFTDNGSKFKNWIPWRVMQNIP